MMHAYDEMYLEDAMCNLGEAFDYAINTCKLDAQTFVDMFVTVGVSRQFETGTAAYVAGMSGTELFLEVAKRAGMRVDSPKADCSYDCSPEYWCGWILAYYQWYTGRTFKNILNFLSVDDILRMYPTLHEASEDRFVDAVDRMIERAAVPTKLQVLRRAVGYSQRMLADKTGVGLRMIQQYEQRAKDINKASASNLLAISRVLGCRMEDLLEQDV